MDNYNRKYKPDDAPTQEDIANSIVEQKGRCDFVIHGCFPGARGGAVCPLYTPPVAGRGGICTAISNTPGKSDMRNTDQRAVHLSRIFLMGSEQHEL